MRRGGSEEQIFSTKRKASHERSDHTDDQHTFHRGRSFRTSRGSPNSSWGEGAGDLSNLPVLCYALVPSNEPGRRIVLIKAGERGYYVTDFDAQAMELAEARILG